MFLGESQAPPLPFPNFVTTRELPAPTGVSGCAGKAWSGPDARRAQRGRGEELTEHS